MALFYFGNPLIGENTKNDFLIDHAYNGKDNVIIGLGGNDVLKADQQGMFLASTPGVAITNSPQFWSTTEDTTIINSTTVPHTTTYFEPTAPGILEFNVSVGAGAQITLDVDFGYDIGAVEVTDTEIQIFAANGTTLLASNDDGSIDIGSRHTFDSFLQHTFATAGTFVVRVIEHSSVDTNFEVGDSLLLNISLTGQPTATGVDAPLVGDDRLYGGPDDDALFGNGGNDTFYGGSGADAHYGGSGVDTVRYDDGLLHSALVISLVNPASNTGTAAGDTYFDIENVAGGSGNDTITGNSAVNHLFGLEGNDKLNGAGGADTMEGGVGNDTYYVDNLADKVIEASGGGTVDQVVTTVNYTLAAGQQIEYLQTNSTTGTANLILTGNELGQTITGNNGNNNLYGGGGIDTLSGLGGLDALDGQAGHDTLTGGAGADKFVFRQSGLTAVNSDVITDFAAGDSIYFDTALGGGAINPTTFVNGTAALGPEDRFIYDSATGNLFFDVDGTGATGQILLATLGTTTHFALAAADIFLF